MLALAAGGQASAQKSAWHTPRCGPQLLHSLESEHPPSQAEGPVRVISWGSRLWCAGQTLACFPWHRLPREVGDVPSLETSKVGLEGGLSNLIRLKMCLLTAGGLDQMAFKGPFQPKLCCDSVSYLTDKKAGVKAPSMHRIKVPSSRSRAQLRVGGSGPRAGCGSPFPGMVDLPSLAPHQGAEGRGLQRYLSGRDIPLLLSPPQLKQSLVPR